MKAPPVVVFSPPPLPETQVEFRPRRSGLLAKFMAPAAGLLALLGKFKTIGLLALKFGGTAGTMLLSIWVYAISSGWPFATGFVLLIFVHECGHLLAARRLGLRVSAPMFIPFFGALIILKETPRNAWVEAQVGIAGPLLGSLGAVFCLGIFGVTGDPLYVQLALTAFMINLFNLTPIGFLDGGRVVTVLSPWLWLGGLLIMVPLALKLSNPLIWILLVCALPRLFSLFRPKTAEEQRYYEATPAQRWIMGSLYFGLAGALALGLALVPMLLNQ
jgi:Zn-dependent protease